MNQNSFYDVDDFYELISILENEVENFIYIINRFKENNNFNAEEHLLLDNYINVFSLLKDYNYLFERSFFI